MTTANGMTTINAHFIGRVFVPDEPVNLAEGTAVELRVRQRDRAAADVTTLLSRLPLLKLSPEDAAAINLDPDFSVEES